MVDGEEVQQAAWPYIHICPPYQFNTPGPVSPLVWVSCHTNLRNANNSVNFCSLKQIK